MLNGMDRGFKITSFSNFDCGKSWDDRSEFLYHFILENNFKKKHILSEYNQDF